jgi:hypothetical protein
VSLGGQSESLLFSSKVILQKHKLSSQSNIDVSPIARNNHFFILGLSMLMLYFRQKMKHMDKVKSTLPSLPFLVKFSELSKS